MSTATAEPLDTASFEFVRKLVLDRSSIALEATKSYLVESRLAPVARQHGLGSTRELIAALQRAANGPLHDLVVDAMTTNETSFFRDVHPFDALRTQLLPELLPKRAPRKTLNVWSAACSSGQEPYSVAILLREHFPQLSAWTVKIHATDLSREMLRKAAKGEYNQLEVNRGLPANCLVKYFERDGLRWTIKRELRDTVTFAQLNLTDSWSQLPQMDVIFMRNVLIYFTAETKRQILAKVHRQLAPDGALFLGGAETTLGLNERFQRISHGKTTIYRPEGAGSPAAAK